MIIIGEDRRHMRFAGLCNETRKDKGPKLSRKKPRLQSKWQTKGEVHGWNMKNRRRWKKVVKYTANKKRQRSVAIYGRQRYRGAAHLIRCRYWNHYT